MPSTTDTTAMRNITPMKTPMIEKPLLSFCARMVWKARRTASRKDTPLFVSQRFHRVEPRRLTRGVDTEQQSRHRCGGERQDDRAQRHISRNGRKAVQQDCDDPAQHHPDDAADERERCRLDQKLPHD